MEMAGLTIGAVSLASLFTTCVDCFEYVQLGRSFGRDFHTCQLKLDLIRLRLSRWAAAVNESFTGSEDDARKAKQILSEIISLFADAEKVSNRLRPTADSNVLVYNPDTDPDTDFRALHTKMQELALQRQKRTAFVKKAAWALHEEKHFRRLIEDVGELVNGLVDLFPAVTQRQEELSWEEANEMASQPALETLEVAAEGTDPLLQASAQEVLANQGQHRYTKNFAIGDARVRYGDEHAGYSTTTGGTGHIYESNIASGKAKVQYGNRFGGKSIFD